MTPERERALTAETQEKHLLFLCFHLFCRFFWIFFFCFLPPQPLSVVVFDVIGTMKSKLFFFPIKSHFYCCYKTVSMLGFFSSGEVFVCLFVFSIFLVSIF